MWHIWLNTTILPSEKPFKGSFKPSKPIMCQIWLNLKPKNRFLILNFCWIGHNKTKYIVSGCSPVGVTSRAIEPTFFRIFKWSFIFLSHFIKYHYFTFMETIWGQFQALKSNDFINLNIFLTIRPIFYLEICLTRPKTLHLRITPWGEYSFCQIWSTASILPSE